MNGIDVAAARKQRELEAKVAALRRELDDWIAVSDEGKDYEKHYSQIRRIAARLNPALTAVADDLKTTAGNADCLLSRAETIEQDILDLHRIWDYFRSKIALRATPEFRRFLAVADDFAWSCYEPAIRKTGAERREPPLVFFNADPSPFAMRRDAAYEIPGGQFKPGVARELLRALPVPVVGIPWFQINHLPDLLIVAHEIGHHVEDDLGLSPQLDQAVDAAAISAGHRELWRGWIGETFADIYGALSAGSAYALALLNFLIADRRRITETSAVSPLYPPPYLRLRITIAAVAERRELANDLVEAWSAWKQAFPTHAMAGFDDDCPLIVSAILEQTVSARVKIGDLVSFKDGDRHAAEAAAIAVDPTRDFATTDVRELVAAAAFTFHGDPSGYSAGPQKRLLDHIVDSAGTGKRGGVVQRDPNEAAIGIALLERMREGRMK